MSGPFSTLCLDVGTWDLIADASGNIARADPPYAVAQDVASAIKTFLGEVWYDDTIGIPYQTKILGQVPPLSIFKQYMVAAALTVPSVVSAVCVIQSYSRLTRRIVGQVQFQTSDGTAGTVGIGPPVAAGISNPAGLSQGITTITGIQITTLGGEPIETQP
jgi:hypothetical protein